MAYGQRSRTFFLGLRQDTLHSAEKPGKPTCRLGLYWARRIQPPLARRCESNNCFLVVSDTNVKRYFLLTRMDAQL